MTDPTKRTEKAVVAAPDSPTPKKRPGLGMARREQVRLVGAGVLGALLVAFALLNLDAVEVNWLLGTWSTPLIVVILVATLFGMAIDRVLVRRSRKREH